MADLSISERAALWSFVPQALAERWTANELGEKAGCGHHAATTPLREIQELIKSRVEGSCVRIATDASTTLAEAAACDLKTIAEFNRLRQGGKKLDKDQDAQLGRAFSRTAKIIQLFNVKLDPALIDTGNQGRIASSDSEPSEEFGGSSEPPPQKGELQES